MTAFSPPPDLDARYEPYAPFAEWQRAEVELRLVDEAAALLDRERREADPGAVRSALDFTV